MKINSISEKVKEFTDCSIISISTVHTHIPGAVILNASSIACFLFKFSKRERGNKKAGKKRESYEGGGSINKSRKQASSIKSI